MGRDPLVAKDKLRELSYTPLMTHASDGLQRVRKPAVAGIYYPGGATQLANTVDDYVKRAPAPTEPVGKLRALITPHAGYRYSGAVAGHAFAQLKGLDTQKIILLGPSHHVAFRGVALSTWGAFETPLGKVRLFGESALPKNNSFVRADAPHEQEHSLEVEIPFLQRTMSKFELLPLVFGDVDERPVAEGLASLVAPDTLLMVSTDLSHHLDYEAAVARDRATIDSILNMQPSGLDAHAACGQSPVRALLHLAQWNKWQPRLLSYQNSGDTAGDRSRVVGYAAIAFYEV